MSSTSHHHTSSANEDSSGGEGSKLALLAALGLLVGYGSYRYSKTLLSKPRRPDPVEEEKKAANTRDQKNVDRIKRIEL